MNEPNPDRSLKLDASGGGTYQDDESRTNFVPPSGLSGDGVVGFVDVLLGLANWGDCPA